MQKVVLILCIVECINGGCSVFIKTENLNNRIQGVSGTENILNIVENKNITNNNFFIQKAEIIISEKEETKKIIANVKFIKPDRYLFSLRTITGIEFIRIYISKDTILVNDRINRKILCGEPAYLKRKYDISSSLLMMIFGDVIADNILNSKEINCTNGKAVKESYLEGRRISSIIDCSKNKMISASIIGSNNEDKIDMWFKKFVPAGKRLIARKIDIEYLNKKIKVKIFIKKIEIPWSGEIEFIPGQGYEVIRLI